MYYRLFGFVVNDLQIGNQFIQCCIHIQVCGAAIQSLESADALVGAVEVGHIGFVVRVIRIAQAIDSNLPVHALSMLLVQGSKESFLQAVAGRHSAIHLQQFVRGITNQVAENLEGCFRVFGGFSVDVLVFFCILLEMFPCYREAFMMADTSEVIETLEE